MWQNEVHAKCYLTSTEIKCWIIFSLTSFIQNIKWGPPWPWSYGILCNHCLSPLKFWVWIPLNATCTRCNVCQWPCGRSPIFFGYSGFLHQLNRPPWYNWNIVESGVNTITLALMITPKYLHLPVFLINTHIETFV